jgi:hypothetical protein
MYFDTKNYLKSTRNHNTKHTLVDAMFIVSYKARSAPCNGKLEKGSAF